MDDNAKLALLRVMQGTTESEEVLSTYLQIAGSKIVERAFPYGQYVTTEEGEQIRTYVVPDCYATLQVEIADYLLNKRGAEGQISHSESGVSRTYGSADVPRELIGQVTPMVGVL